MRDTSQTSAMILLSSVYHMEKNK